MHVSTVLIDSTFRISILIGELLNNDHQKTIPIKCFEDSSDLVEAITKRADDITILA